MIRLRHVRVGGGKTMKVIASGASWQFVGCIMEGNV